MRAILGLLALVVLSGTAAGAQKAVRFTAPGDYVEVAHAPALAPTQFTIEFWLRVHDVGDPDAADGEQTILDKRQGGAGYNFRLAGTSFPLPLFAFAEPGGVAVFDVIDRDYWFHFAVTQDADSLKIYADGVLGASDANAYVAGTTGDLRIGEFVGYPGAYLGLRGDIDELRVWDHARSTSEIQSMMHEKATGTEPGLAACYDFDSQVGNVVPDLTPNGNDGLLHGGASLIDSDAPIGFVPPPPPLGFRAYGETDHIELVWESAGPEVTAFRLYRGDSLEFPVDATTLLTTITTPDTSYADHDVLLGANTYYELRAVDGEGHLSRPGDTVLSRTLAIQSGYMTGVYYYPWYGTDWGGHEWDEAYLRYYLVPPQLPLLGHHSSRDPEMIRLHLSWMQSFGIDFLVSSWWGPNSREDVTLRDFMLAEIEGTPIQFTVFYESAILGFEPEGFVIDAAKEQLLVDHFHHIADTYFDHPNFLRVDGKPVVFVYLSILYAGDYEQAFARIRSELLAEGHELFLVGDEVGWAETSASHMQFLDAVTSYIMLTPPTPSRYPTTTGFFGDISTHVGEWESVAHPQGKMVIPDVHPGFNAHDGGQGALAPRPCRPGSESTSTLETYIRVMRPFVDPQLKMLMITSWNEWHEDTQIEPTIVAPPTSTDTSPSGHWYTQGYVYEGYGFKPLAVVRSLLGDDPAVGVEAPEAPAPEMRGLRASANAFSTATTVSYFVPRRSRATLRIFNSAGRLVERLVDGERPPGWHWETWRPHGLGSGVYFVRLTAGGLSEELKILLVR